MNIPICLCLAWSVCHLRLSIYARRFAFVDLRSSIWVCSQCTKYFYFNPSHKFKFLRVIKIHYELIRFSPEYLGFPISLHFLKITGKTNILLFIFLVGNLHLHHKILNNILNKVFWVNWFDNPACTLWSKIHLRCSVILCSLRTWGWGLSHNVAQWYYVPWGHWVQANLVISSIWVIY